MPDPYEALKKAKTIEPEPGLVEQAIAFLVGGLGLSGVPVPTATGAARAMGDSRASRLGEAVAMLAGVPVAGVAKKGIRAFHGSPHDFDKFSLSQIGTGEGAQTYGHGLYFAENEGVARAYREKLKTAPGGRMYEVNINADPEMLLDWDVPLSEQGEGVRKAMEQAYRDQGNNPGLEQFGAEATRRMRQAGIPGIKYLDKGSRAAGEGSRNYVIFDADLVEIMRKYGLLPPLAAGLANEPDAR